MNFRPDLTTLRMFLAVYRQGNMTKAAEREHIAPSAISKRIQDLELEIGTPLFYRHARGMTATPAGDALARHTAGLFDDVNRMAAELSVFSKGEEGQARLHAHQSAVVQHLPQELAAFAGPYAAGVTYPTRRQIHSTRSSHLHEIVHLVAAQLGDPGPFFHEGLAIAIAEPGRGRDARRLMPPSLARPTSRASSCETGFMLPPDSSLAMGAWERAVRQLSMVPTGRSFNEPVLRRRHLLPTHEDERSGWREQAPLRMCAVMRRHEAVS